MINDNTTGATPIFTSTPMQHKSFFDTCFTGIDICTTCNFPRACCICNVTATSAHFCEFPHSGCTCGKHQEKKEKEQKKEKIWITYSYDNGDGIGEIGPAFIDERIALAFIDIQNINDKHYTWTCKETELRRYAL